LSEGEPQLAKLEERLEVTIRYGAVEKKIIGAPELVAQETFSFLMKTVPELELASRLTLSTDIRELAKECEGVIAVTPEGVVTIARTETLADRELILLHLAEAQIAHFLGKREKDFVQSADLVNATKKTAGTVAGRLSELCSEKLVERKGKGEYRATTLGMHVFREQVLPKLKSKSQT